MLKDPTQRELEVLAAFVRQGSVENAAEELNLSKSAVNAHLDHLRERFDLKTRTQLVALAVEQGWLPPHCWDN